MGVENKKHMWDFFWPDFLKKGRSALLPPRHAGVGFVTSPEHPTLLCPLRPNVPSTQADNWLCILIRRGLCSVAGRSECCSCHLRPKSLWHGHLSHGSEPRESCGRCRVAIGDTQLLAGYSSAKLPKRRNRRKAFVGITLRVTSCNKTVTWDTVICHFLESQSWM